MLYQISKHNTLITKSYKGVLTSIMNRPDKLNAVNVQLCQDIADSFQNWDKHNVVILQGNGRAFCAGGDLKHVFELALKKQIDFTLGDLTKITVDMVNNTKSVFITMINGYVMGIGAGLGLHAPIRIATESSRFAMPEVRVGLVPDGGSGKLFAQMPHNFGVYLGLTGEQIDGVQMCHLGLADFLVENEQLNKIAHDIEESHLLRDVNSIKQFISEKYCKKRHTSLFDIPRKMEMMLGQDNLLSIYKNIRHAFPEIGEKLQFLSPFASMVFFESHRRNLEQKLSLRDNLLLEQRILERICLRSDIFEGLTRLFANKEHVPQWNPINLENVNLQEVMECFQPIQREELQFKK